MARRGALMRGGAVLVPEAQLRQLFAQNRILERLALGEVREDIVRSGTPSPDSGQDAGTMSRYVAYFDRWGVLLAEAHYFLRQDGSIGASGLIDPKLVLHEGVIYLLDEP
jgi:hypothetical protein